MNHYPAFICENGHIISTGSDFCADRFCMQCGAPVIKECPHCETPIRGDLRDSCFIGWSMKAPAYCHHCGKPYPWTLAAIDATVALLKESELSFDEQQRIIDVLPDAMTETPKTQFAAVRIQKAINTAEKFVADGLTQFAITYGCELLMKLLNLS